MSSTKEPTTSNPKKLNIIIDINGKPVSRFKLKSGSKSLNDVIGFCDPFLARNTKPKIPIVPRTITLNIVPKLTMYLDSPTRLVPKNVVSQI